MKDVDDLKIYQFYMDLMLYSEMIIDKFPKIARYNLGSSIKSSVYGGMKCLLYAYKVYKFEDKLNYLDKLDVNLKFIKSLIRVSYKRKYISLKNYEAWSRKLNKIGAYLGGWINGCHRQLKEISIKN